MTRCHDPELAEFFRALDIGLQQLYGAADALAHIAQSLAEGGTTTEDCIGDLNEARSLILAGASSVLDAVALRVTVHEMPR